jgi:hypothetical protein
MERWTRFCEIPRMSCILAENVSQIAVSNVALGVDRCWLSKNGLRTWLKKKFSLGSA